MALALGLLTPDRATFERPAPVVAPLLLGAHLQHRTADGDVTLRITEVEAYQGTGEDPGSHAHRGLTKRNAVMFGPAAHLYAYFTYGMHVCANITTGTVGAAGGLLLRAGEVVAGLDLARGRRITSKADTDLACGPARLARAMGILLGENGADVLSGADFELRFADPIAPERIRTGPRVGVSGPGGDAEFYPWRFWIDGDPTVSQYRAAAKRRQNRDSASPLST